MGWLAGILSGYADRQHEIRRENAALAEQAAKREADIYSALLNHDNEEIRGMAATGIMQMGQPRKSATGLAGWMGKMQSSPIYPTLMKYMATPQKIEREVKIPGLPSTQTQGYLSMPPGQTSSLAQPATSPTEGGEMATPQPLPGSLETDPAPPPPPAQVATTEADVAPAAGPPPAPPQLASTPSAGASPAAATAPPFSTPPPAPPDFPAAGFTTRQAPGDPNAGRRTDVSYETPHFPTIEETNIKAARAKEMGDYEALVDVGRRSGEADPEGWAADLIAQERARAHSGSATPYQSLELEYIDPVSKQIVKSLGSFDKAQNRYLLANGQPLPQGATLTKALPASALGMGTWANMAMNELHVTPLQVRNDPALAQQVEELAAQMRQGASYATGTGAARARFDAPITIPQAQASQLPGGTTAAQVAGQAVPRTVDVERQRSVTQMRGWLDQIDQALDVLPSKNDLGGLFPGAAIKYRRALPAYREAFAKLDSDINQILASLSRAVQQNVGTQTEQDARRAMDTLALVQGKLLNPLDGDTQESARARLAETRAYLDTVLQSIPPTPVPGPPQPPAPLPALPTRQPSAVPSASPPAAAGTTSAPRAAAPAAAGTAGGVDPSEVPPPGVRMWTSPTGKVWVNGKQVSR